MRILYAEDERGLSEAVVDILVYHNYAVDAVYDGETALAYAKSEEYDGIILDIMMPDISGLDVLKELRRLGHKTPIMLLTAKAEIEDQILGLDSGADDYLPKPFSMDLLLAHVRALLRRRPDYISRMLAFGNAELDQESHDLYVSNQKMTNQSLRERFSLSETKADAASRIISDAVAAEMIKPDDPESRSKRYAKYIPYWA